MNRALLIALLNGQKSGVLNLAEFHRQLRIEQQADAALERIREMADEARAVIEGRLGPDWRDAKPAYLYVCEYRGIEFDQYKFLPSKWMRHQIFNAADYGIIAIDSICT